MWRALASAAAAGGAVAAVLWSADLPVVAPREGSAFTAEVEPRLQDVACPGPVSVPVGDLDSPDPVLGSGADDRTIAVYTRGSTRRAGEGVASDAAIAASVERVGSGDVAGLAAITCTRALTDQWILGGATTIGDSARLVLTNPAAVAVEATVTIYGSLGKDAERVVAIAPFGQGEMLLEGVSPEIAALAVRVQAPGVGIVAAIQDSRLNGFQAAGTDWASAAVPAPDLVVPDVGAVGVDSTAVLRLLAPEGAIVSLGLRTPDTDVVWEGVRSLQLEPGLVVDVPIPAVDVGAVTVSGDGPVLASALITVPRVSATVEGALAADIAWVRGQAVDEASLAAVAPGYTAALAVYAPRAGVFQLTTATGRVLVDLQLAADETARVPISVPAGSVLTGTASFAWTLRASDAPGFLTFVEPGRTDADAETVTVGVATYVPLP